MNFDVLQLSRGIPPEDFIPVRELTAITAKILEREAERMFQYSRIGKHRGDPMLLGELGALHGVDPDRIFVGNGSLQVLDLVTGHLLRGDNSTVYVEEPTYDRALQIFERHGANLVAIPMQSDGVNTEVFEQRLVTDPPVFFYTIPEFQNPTGVTMSITNRRKIVELSTRFGFSVIEDIAYRALSYRGQLPPLLSTMAGQAKVITIGSLSKTLSPGLRIGYAISDGDTALSLAALAEATYISAWPLSQAIAAHCLKDGIVSSNITRIRKILLPRHDAAVAATRKLFGERLFSIPNGGYFLGSPLNFPDERAFIAAAAKEGISLTAGSAFYTNSQPRGTIFLRLPFHALFPDQFEEAISRLMQLASKTN